MENKVRIAGIIQGSIAEETGIEPKDLLVSINGEEICDVFDYRFLVTDENICVTVQKANSGEFWDIEIEKDAYEDIGLEFENELMDSARCCTNKCIFCFIDQLPPGMRETLYFKDDDTRLSFLTGNYVTLTNMKDKDIDRIIRYRMSPVNVSVHTTNPELRKHMLNNRFAGDILDRLKRLTDAGIEVNTQIVLCPGVNDDAELDRTILDLSGLHPGMHSISAVPVGITRHREGLRSLKPFDRENAHKIVLQVEAWQRLLIDKYGTRIVYLADEFYLMSGLDIPQYDYYEDFPQIENGVGLVASMKQEFFEYLDCLRYKLNSRRTVSIATGTLAAGFIRQLSSELMKRCPGLEINVYEILNSCFGETVTVSGLLTGKDIMEQLRGKQLGEQLFISSSMLRKGEQILLDDVSIDEMENELMVKISAVNNDGCEFVQKILGMGCSLG